LHQDKDDLISRAIVSSCRWPACDFPVRRIERSDRTRRFRLEHGDVAVWGGPSRLIFGACGQGEHPVGPAAHQFDVPKVRENIP
jgi:alkylated DNA repair protein (DNA oxidative demethylase)